MSGEHEAPDLFDRVMFQCYRVLIPPLMRWVFAWWFHGLCAVAFAACAVLAWRDSDLVEFVVNMIGVVGFSAMTLTSWIVGRHIKKNGRFDRFPLE